MMGTFRKLGMISNICDGEVYKWKETQVGDNFLRVEGATPYTSCIIQFDAYHLHVKFVGLYNLQPVAGNVYVTSGSAYFISCVNCNNLATNYAIQWQTLYVFCVMIKSLFLYDAIDAKSIFVSSSMCKSIIPDDTCWQLLRPIRCPPEMMNFLL